MDGAGKQLRIAHGKVGDDLAAKGVSHQSGAGDIPCTHPCGHPVGQLPHLQSAAWFVAKTKTREIGSVVAEPGSE